MHRIDIPNANPPEVAHAAADIVIRVIRECGADPRKVYNNPMGQAIALEWRDGRFTEAQFHKALGNLLILNPSLRSDRA